MRRRRLRRRVSIVVALLGIAVVAYGAWIVLRYRQTISHHPSQEIVTLIPPSDFPRGGLPLGPTPPAGTRIRLVDVGIDLPVVPGDGWNAPLYKAATYPGLRLPGEGGRAVVYAHARRGMFGPLVQTRLGQAVEVDFPDGRVLHYKIVEIERSWPATDVRWLQPLDHEELVLVTCTTYNPDDPRVVVIAAPIA